MRTLLVEDEPDLASMVRTALERQGFVVDLVSTVAMAEEALALIEHDVVLLDRQLADGDGIELIPMLRQRRPGVPVIVISALGKPLDRIHGLEQGADDYLAKPFLIEELVARMRAVLRRPTQMQDQAIAFGNVSFDVLGGEAEVDGHPLVLQRRERLALEALMRRAGQTLRRSSLEESMYGADDEIQSNSLEAIISRLRRKLADMGANVEIHPVRGVGYLLREMK
ncbi:response regulator transcription factor [Devosia elaeis]|uniref:DNA-binding response regulator n=1 Tax=Devosia elaeis TaxID=1770058 RepID=A0A178HW72_9HYPH|nr:response regulator transcription factor [Devosia elaeis]OAM77122.1 DNA-binding response regulator [Devosia elaeis]